MTRARPGSPALVLRLLVPLALVVTLLGPTVGVAPAGAHTDLIQGSPGPSQLAGGTVDFVDLAFLAPVSDVEVEVIGPEGETIDGRLVVAEGQIIRYEMTALTEPGRHAVRYSMRSDDGDLTTSGYFFEFEPEALPPVRLGEVDIPTDTMGIVRRVALVAAGLSLAGLVAILAIRLLRSRAALAAERRAGV